MARTKATPKKAPAKTAKPKEALIKRSVLRVLILTFVSFGLYSFYWFYVIRKQLNEALGEQSSLTGVSPLLQTIGPAVLTVIAIPLMLILIGFLLLPAAVVLAVVVWYYLIKDINRVRESVDLEATPPALYILGYVVLSFMSPANLALIGLLAFQLNEAWDKRTKGAAREARYTAGEIIVSLSGLILFGFLFIVFILIAVLASSQ